MCWVYVQSKLAIRWLWVSHSSLQIIGRTQQPNLWNIDEEVIGILVGPPKCQGISWSDCIAIRKWTTNREKKLQIGSKEPQCHSQDWFRAICPHDWWENQIREWKLRNKKIRRRIGNDREPG